MFFTVEILVCFYSVYQGFRLNFGKNSKIIIYESLLTTFNVSAASFRAAQSLKEFGFSLLKANHHNQVKLVQIPDTLCR